MPAGKVFKNLNKQMTSYTFQVRKVLYKKSFTNSITTTIHDKMKCCTI